MISDLDFILQTIAQTEQLREDWESAYYDQLNLIGHSGWASERDNDFLNEAQNEITLANERISMLEAALDELEDPLEPLGSHHEH